MVLLAGSTGSSGSVGSSGSAETLDVRSYPTAQKLVRTGSVLMRFTMVCRNVRGVYDANVLSLTACLPPTTLPKGLEDPKRIFTCQLPHFAGPATCTKVGPGEYSPVRR